MAETAAQKAPLKIEIETAVQKAPFALDVEIVVQKAPIDLRWIFTRRVFSIMTAQMISVEIFGLLGRLYYSTTNEVFTSDHGLLSYCACLSITIGIAFSPKDTTHLVNLLRICIFTATLTVTVGLPGSFAKGVIVLEAVLLTGTSLVGMCVYSYWAVFKGYEFDLYAPFQFGVFFILITSIIQGFFGFGEPRLIFYGIVIALVLSGAFCQHVTYMTNNYSHLEYVNAVLYIYKDSFNLVLDFFKSLCG